MQALLKTDMEILVATMNRNSLDFLVDMFPFANFYDFNILIINQTTPDTLLQSDYDSVRVINSFEKGLSASRNLALQNAAKKLCLIADDDIVYEHDFQEIVLKAFNQNPDAVLITFRSLNANRALSKKYPTTRKEKPSVLDRLSIMSIEMVLNNEALKTKNIKFNTHFGLGTVFPLGEEAVLVNDLHKKQGKIIMEPYVINTHSSYSTSEKISNTEKYFTLGAVYTAIFKRNYFLFIFLKFFFDVKQDIVKLSDIFKLFKVAVSGRRKYKIANE